MMAQISAQIEQFRPFLRLLAEAQTNTALKARVDLSGVVQQSLWEGSRTIATAGPGHALDLAKLLRRILANNLQDEIRRATAQRRDVRLEQSIESSSVRLCGLLAGDEPGPSQNAIAGERALMVAEAIIKLSHDQREVIVRHYLAGDTIDATAVGMSRSVASVAGLLHRALKQLRKILEQTDLRDPEKNT
jgi:RNA polymerase sigma-70 factor, ECF subfamily